MIMVSDRTVVGTIRGCVAALEEPYVGPRGHERLACSRSALEAFVNTTSRLDLPSPRDSYRFHTALQDALSFALCERPARLQMDVCESRSHRKQTHLSRVDRDGEPWLVLKTFSESELGHQSLRAYREVEGARSFGRIEGVSVPEVVDVFSLHGEGIPTNTLLVAESFLPGRTLLQRMWEAPSPRHVERLFREAARACGLFLSRVHTATASPESVCGEEMFDEVTGFCEELVERGALDQATGRATLGALERRLASLAGCETVLAHRDFTTGNLLVDDDGGVSLIDFEKSDREYAVKDVAKFTETLHVDAALMGYAGSQEEDLQSVFLEGYGASESKRAAIVFYQLYTTLALIRFHARRGSRQSVDVLLQRIRKLAEL